MGRIQRCQEKQVRRRFWIPLFVATAPSTLCVCNCARKRLRASFLTHVRMHFAPFSSTPDKSESRPCYGDGDILSNPFLCTVFLCFDVLNTRTH